MIECYENKFLMICRYQYVCLPLPPEVAQVAQILPANIIAKKERDNNYDTNSEISFTLI